MVNVAHQHGIDLHFFEASGKGGIDAVHHLTKLVLAGDGVKLTRIEAVHADVNCRQPGIAPAFNIPRQPVAVGGDRNLANGGIFPHGGDDVGKIATQRRLTAGQAHLFRPQGGERAGDVTDLIDAEEAFISDGAGLIAIGQAVGATKVADVGN